MSKWKTTEARASCVLDQSFQLYGSLLPLITLTYALDLQFGLGLCYPCCSTKTQEIFFCLGCICHNPWTLAAAWSLTYTLDESAPEPEGAGFLAAETPTMYSDELWWDQIQL